MFSVKQLTRVSQKYYKSLPRSFQSCSANKEFQARASYSTSQKLEDVVAPTRVPETADVVVIGGGSLGCSTIYHLAKLGITNVVLLEAHQLTAGTTWHSAGLVWSLRPSDTEIQLLSRTRKLLTCLEEETGIEPGWINNGGMFIASTEERLNEYKRLMTTGKAFGVESHVIGPTEAKKMYPLMNVDDVYGVLYCADDGTLEPAGFCSALSRYAKRQGAQIFENCRVESITTNPTLLGGKEVKSVQTTNGTIKTNCVVNATENSKFFNNDHFRKFMRTLPGCWANDIANMVGVEIPLVPMKHAYVVTERIEGIENMPNVRDHDASVYLRLQGDALSVGGYEQNPILLDQLGKDDSFTLYDLDWDVFGSNINGAINRVPILERSGIKSTVCGPESFTPDHKPILGEDPNVSGFYHCCGFNSAGMMLGGGCGQEMAHWIVHGRPSLDMYGYDIRRFPSQLNADKEWAAQKSHEAYAKNYAIAFPHDEPLAGRGKRKSPLHEILEAQGCIYQERHGWERPGWFSNDISPVVSYDYNGAYGTPQQLDTRYKEKLHNEYSYDFPKHFDAIKNEVLACRNTAALFDMSYFGKYIITGSDAQKAADWLFTANVQREAGRVVYSCMLNERGGTESDLTVSILDSTSHLPFGPNYDGRSFYLGVGGGAALQNLAHITKEARKQNFDINITDHSEELAMLSIQGPASRLILQSLTDDSFSNDDFPFSTHRVVNIAGHTVVATRITFPGEMGWELLVPKADAVSVYKALMNVGKPIGLINAGYRALESLSTEKGYCHWHADLRLDDTPLEAGLGFTCKLKTDIPFLGRNSLEKQKLEGLKRKHVTLVLEDPSVPLWGMETIWKDDSLVGLVRTADYAFTLNKTIVHGYVTGNEVLPKDFLKTGTWKIESMGTKHDATVCLKSLFDPQNLRIKGHYANIDPKLVFDIANVEDKIEVNA